MMPFILTRQRDDCWVVQFDENKTRAQQELETEYIDVSVKDRDDLHAAVWIESYSVVVSLEGRAFDRALLNRLSSKYPLPRCTNEHRLYASPDPSLCHCIIMNTDSRAQLERQLALIHKHLLPGTFDGDERGRSCKYVNTTVRFPRIATLLRAYFGEHFQRADDDEDDDATNYYKLRCHFGDMLMPAGIDSDAAVSLTLGLNTACSVDNFSDFREGVDDDDDSCSSSSSSDEDDTKVAIYVRCDAHGDVSDQDTDQVVLCVTHDRARFIDVLFRMVAILIALLDDGDARNRNT